MSDSTKTITFPAPDHVELTSSARVFDGEVRTYRHDATETRCSMEWSVTLPPQAFNRSRGRLPTLLWLSGLTCTSENFTVKAGAQRLADEYGVIVLAPDTSPRGDQVPDAPERWDLGQGAGFYVDATTAGWADHYRMYSYVTSELLDLATSFLPIDRDRLGVFGHSMGGHGALICALKNPGLFRSVSALAPIVTPSQVQWGRDAFTTYLGPDEESWAEWDASKLIASAQERLPILIDQGTADSFLDTQLRPRQFADLCAAHDHPCTLRLQEGYDHSYWFVQTFLPDHFAHHIGALEA